jgi:prepilin-type processing-associated H-X9-DG protein
MEAQIKCPHCGHTNRVTPDPQDAGQAIACTNCQQPVVAAKVTAATRDAIPPRLPSPPHGIPPAFPNTQAYSQYVPPPQRGGNGLAIASVVFGLLGFVIPFIGGIVGLILGVRALTKRRNTRRRGKKLAIIGINVSALSILTCLLVLPSALSHAREAANRVKCAANMRTIGAELLLYGFDHGEHYPPTLDPLLTTKNIPASAFVCPSTHDTPLAQSAIGGQGVVLTGRHLSYVYLGKGMNTSMASDAVVLYEKPANHGGAGCNFLFGDGHVEWINQPMANKLIASVQAGPNPPSRQKSRSLEGPLRRW